LRKIPTLFAAFITSLILAGGAAATAGATDWDRDGHQDIITRQDSTGDLWLYPGDSRRGPAQTSRVKIGNGWTGFTSFGA
jgi:hypothetical protein